MDLLFRREQTAGRLLPVIFKLWSKIEFTDEEQALSDRYRLADAALVITEQEHLVRHSVQAGVAVAAGMAVVLYFLLGFLAAFLLALSVGLGAGYLYYTEMRETIYVKDLLHGRYFRCLSVVTLLEKEAELVTLAGSLRQLMEAAKNWGGTERLLIAPPEQSGEEWTRRVS